MPAPRVLIIGGTGFLGRHLTAAAVARGWHVTLLNRGRTAPDRFPDVPTLVGDRDGDVESLAIGQWDAVWDTCGYVPRIVGRSAAHFADRAEHYTFVSTLSVYGELAGSNPEDTALAELQDPSTETVTAETYGGLKAACERTATASFGVQRTLHVRAGLIVGPHDRTDRFAYWPHRIARGGQVLAPGRPEAQIQVIDVRDLTDWIIAATTQRLSGPYNLIGPASPLSMGTFLETTRQLVNPNAELVWVPDEVLVDRGVSPWVGLPLWIPDTDLTTDRSKAIAAGLTFRTLADTVAATHEWLTDTTRPDAFANALDPETERQILASVA